MRTAAALLATAALALAAVGCGGGDAAGGKDAYVRENEELLDSLRRFPGAREIERVSSPYFEGTRPTRPWPAIRPGSSSSCRGGCRSGA